MPTVVLNDITIRAFDPPEKGQVTYWDKGLSGFGVRVSPGGTKSFVLVHGINRRRTTIGRYPSVSLKAARVEAKRMLAERILGGEETTPITSTFDDAKEQFLDACSGRNRPRTVKDYRARIERHFKFGKRQIADITRAEIKAKLARSRHTPSEQNHAFMTLRALFNWAVQEELIAASPMAGMRLPATIPSRERVLSDLELAEVYRTAAEHTYPFGPLVSLLVLLGQRRGETVALEWEWIDEEARVITLPASITKNKRTHRFPYSQQAAKVIAELPRFDPRLFPSRTKGGTVFNGWTKSKKRFDAELSEVREYTLHDLRRTFATNLASFGTPIHVTEKLLNHVSGTISGVAAVYNRHSYLDEMRTAVEAYETHLAKIAST